MSIVQSLGHGYLERCEQPSRSELILSLERNSQIYFAFAFPITYKNLVYDLAHHESPITQWLERPTGIWKVMGSTPVGDSENSFSEYFEIVLN